MSDRKSDKKSGQMKVQENATALNMNISHAKDIIVVDDDCDLRELLVEYLTQNQYSVLSADGGRQYRQLYQRYRVKLIIMDVVMPGESGLELLAWTKKQDNPPAILMLSAKNSVDDKVSGLEIGAEDYLVKPFEPRELLARIEVIFRRNKQNQATEIKFGEFCYYLKQQQLRKKQNIIPLTTGENQLLQLFCHYQGDILSRDFLTGEIKGYQHDPFDRTIDIRITRLRKKLETDPSHPILIKTIRGKGYQLCLPDLSNT